MHLCVCVCVLPVPLHYGASDELTQPATVLAELLTLCVCVCDTVCVLRVEVGAGVTDSDVRPACACVSQSAASVRSCPWAFFTVTGRLRPSSSLPAASRCTTACLDSESRSLPEGKEY